MDVGGEVAESVNPTDDNSLGGGSDDSASGDTGSNDDSSSSSSGGDSSTSSSSSGGSSDGSTTGSSSSSSDSGSSSSGGNALPGQASIPVILSYDIPSIDEADVYYSTPTEDDVTADTGTAGAIENCDDDADGDNDECTVVMSTSEITEATADRGSPFVDRGSLLALIYRDILSLSKDGDVIPAVSQPGSSFWNNLGTYASRFTLHASLISTAHADYATELSEICSRDGVKCCEGAIAADGSFECYNNFGDTTIYTYVVKPNTDDTLLWSTAPYIDTPNKHVKWHDGSDYHLKSDGTNLFAITQPNDGTDNDVVTMQDDGITWRVTPNSSASYSAGDYVFDTENLWREFGGTEEIDGEKLGYDSGWGLMTVLDPTNGVTAIYSMSFGSATLTTTLPGLPSTSITGFTQIKYSYNSSLASSALMYSVTESTNEAYIYFPLDGVWPYDSDTTTANHIQFTRSIDGLPHTKTIDFDIDSQGNAYVLFECDTTLCSSTERRLRVSDGTNMWGGTRTLRFADSSHTSNDPFVQLMVYYEDTSTNDVRLVMLDRENSFLWNITADTSTRSITTTLNPSTNGHSMPSGSVQMALNSNNSRLYIVGSTELSVVALTNGGSVISPVEVFRGSIADLTGLSTKSFASTLSPSSIIVQDDTIFIGTTGIKSALTINVADITEDTSDIEETTPTSSTTSSSSSGGILNRSGWRDILRLLGN